MTLNIFLAQLSEWLGVVAVSMLTGNNPRFSHRPIIFRYPRREIIVSFALYGLILILAFIALFAAGLPANPLNSRLVLALLGVVPFALALLIRRQPLRSAGWGKQTLRPSVLLGLALAMLVLFLRGIIFTIINHMDVQTGLTLLTWLGISLAEETIFRGYLHIRLVSVWGLWPGIAATAVLYTLWRLPLLLAQGQLGSTLLISLGLALVQGLVLSYLVQKTGNAAAPTLYRVFSEWALSL